MPDTVNPQITDDATTATKNGATGNRSTKIGVIVSNKMQKTVVVAVENLVKHGMYQKYIRRTSKFLAHAEQTDLNVGDRVLIEETRPLSKRKRWNVREVIERAS
jgi:small subunit ribosomal protein S17